MSEEQPIVSKVDEVSAGVSKVLMAAPIFFVAYCLLVVPTYLLPYVGSNSAILNVGIASAVDMGALPAFFWHLFFLAALMGLAWIRGGLIDRAWLVALPTLAAVFDMTPGLNWVPLAPTGFHVATLIMGVNRSPDKFPQASGQARRTTMALAAVALTLLLAVYKSATYENGFERTAREASERQEAE